MRNLRLLSILFLGLALNACGQNKPTDKETLSRDVKKYPQAKTAAYWKQVLSAQAYDIMVNSGTETLADARVPRVNKLQNKIVSS
ncbi:hypothetical protein [Pedobacter jejuensis]|uniref:Uncharacterized protein n=1 Tax=Pedobacter jejuensis TaxID=1268550 RepID=A0A3N0BRY0_9SPHI|nr:hypothetical protein [Pedobacter jejuensis]RNL51825.1 hypothetical protein D7004_13865 [Pedobacter jejuensis]